MDRQDIIDKSVRKLGMLGDPEDPIEAGIKQKMLKRFWGEKNPEKIFDIVNNLIDKYNLSKESVQDLMKFFKLKGLFKRTIPLRGMERMWRTIIKEQRIQGFMLEN